MAQLIDMLRTVPEIAVRLWCGQHDRTLRIQESDDAVRLFWEGRSATISREVYEKAQEVARALSVRPRVLQAVQDVLELRHDAEDIFVRSIFERRDIPTVLFVPAGETASGYYRAMIPADLMREKGDVIAHFTMNVDLAKVLRYDVLWIQLLAAPVLAEIAERARAEGIRIVYDIDDRLDALPDENQAKVVYGTPEMQANIRRMIEAADVVTASTEPLAQHIREQHPSKKVVVLRNEVIANVAPRRHPPNPAYVRILWAGSATHQRDLAIIAPAMRAVLQRHAGKVRFSLLGERMPEALSGAWDWVDLITPVDFVDYHDRLAQIAADFAIAPLEKNEFNSGKSCLKALEYAAAGYPSLLSPAAEYPALVADGFPGEIVPDDGWESSLERMIARTRDERDVMGKRAMGWVITNRCMGTDRAKNWTNVVLSLVKKKSQTEPVDSGSTRR